MRVALLDPPESSGCHRLPPTAIVRHHPPSPARGCQGFSTSRTLLMPETRRVALLDPPESSGCHRLTSPAITCHRPRVSATACHRSPPSAVARPRLPKLLHRTDFIYAGYAMRVAVLDRPGMTPLPLPCAVCHRPPPSAVACHRPPPSAGVWHLRPSTTDCDRLPRLPSLFHRTDFTYAGNEASRSPRPAANRAFAVVHHCLPLSAMTHGLRMINRQPFVSCINNVRADGNTPSRGPVARRPRGGMTRREPRAAWVASRPALLKAIARLRRWPNQPRRRPWRAFGSLSTSLEQHEGASRPAPLVRAAASRLWARSTPAHVPGARLRPWRCPSSSGARWPRPPPIRA